MNNILLPNGMNILSDSYTYRVYKGCYYLIFDISSMFGEFEIRIDYKNPSFRNFVRDAFSTGE